jgi:hypothetical protein
MDAIKGLARRATQTLREKVSHADQTNDDKLNEATRKVRIFEKSSVAVSDKVLKIARIIEDLSTALRDIGEEYRQCPDLSPESAQLAEDMFSFGTTLLAKAQEHQAPLKDQAFDILGNFIRELPKLKDAEEDRKKKQLEYDFFRQKVLELRKSPPKDFTRIPRNEAILENWRQELWKSTESNKAVVSNLYATGQRALDQAVLTVAQVVGSFSNLAAAGSKAQFVNARLPIYSNAPLLQPAPLPPNPLPPFQSPGAYQGAPPPAPYAGAQDTGAQWQNQQQPPPGWQPSQTQPAWGQQGPGGWQPAGAQHQNQSWSPQPPQNTSFAPPPPSQAQQPPTQAWAQQQQAPWQAPQQQQATPQQQAPQQVPWQQAPQAQQQHQWPQQSQAPPTSVQYQSPQHQAEPQNTSFTNAPGPTS